MSEERETSHLRRAAAYLAAWLPYGTLWFLLGRYGGSPSSVAALLGLVRFASAAGLALVIHWLCGRLPWPERVGVRFAAAHVGGALAFGWAILGANVLTFALYEGRSLRAEFAETARYLPFELLTDACLYGLVAAVSYTLRSQQRVREERQSVLRAEAAATRAQLAALRAQVNPHFLFNALHSLAALPRRDPARAEEALARLGGLLRYALDEAGDRVPLSREWDFVRDYLELERLRLDSRLRVEESLGEEALSVLVPPFTLQPLVENAIRHGIAPVPAGGRLRIAARTEGESLVLVVEDDGPGCAPSVLDAANGHGLRSLRERLAADYGDRAHLHIATAPGKGFAVRVELPRTASALGGRPAS
jgi:signal transduction histidine kinase